MFDLYLTEPFVPFTIALALLFGLLALELLLALLGGTLLGLGADADVDLDIDAPDLGDLDIDLGDPDFGDFDLGDTDLDLDADVDSDIDTNIGAGPASWLGMGKVPVLIWFASILVSFGITGIVIQTFANSTLGFSLPAYLVAVPAGVAAIWFARRFGEVFARLLPKTETTAMSERHLGRRVGVVSQGTAKRGMPAEVRVTDRHGNLHYLRAEPVRDSEEIPQGTRVLVLRHRFDHGYRITALGPEA